MQYTILMPLCLSLFTFFTSFALLLLLFFNFISLLNIIFIEMSCEYRQCGWFFYSSTRCLYCCLQYIKCQFESSFVFTLPMKCIAFIEMRSAGVVHDPFLLFLQFSSAHCFLCSSNAMRMLV